MYLQGDVLGLKELSERLNKSCYENFGANLYKYQHHNSHTHHGLISYMTRQTAEHEKFFWESIYGGRTYKYKHKFVSSQRDAYINKQISFEDIDD